MRMEEVEVLSQSRPEVEPPERGSGSQCDYVKDEEIREAGENQLSVLTPAPLDFALAMPMGENCPTEGPAD